MRTVQELQRHSLPTVTAADFFVLLAHATGKEKVFLLAHPEYELAPTEEKKAKQSLERRLKHEPVAYIVGHKEFYGREFLVTSDTLIPRPETELLIERVIADLRLKITDRISEYRNILVVDIGTGSGNIIITLAKEIEQTYPVSLPVRQAGSITYFGLDISPAALAVAKKNAAHHDVADKIIFLESDLLKNFSLTHESNHHLVITANLPYLSEEIYHESDADVRDYEPQSALVSGHDGLDHYRRLLIELKRLARPTRTITVFLEISPEQTQKLTDEIRGIFPQAELYTLHDLSGRDRLIQATL